MNRLDLFVGITCTLILLVVWVAYFSKKNNSDTIFGQHPKVLAYVLTIITFVQIGLWVYYFIKTKNNQLYDASYAIMIGGLFSILPLVLFFGYNLLNELDSPKHLNNNVINHIDNNMEMHTENGISLENGTTTNGETMNLESTASAGLPENLETATN